MRPRIPAIAVGSLLLLASCGGGGAEESAATTTVIDATTTTTTPATSTTLAPVTTTTVAATTTVPPTLPTPDWSLTDPRAEEPRVEIGRIAIPKLDVDKVLLQGISLFTLDQGPGHWPGTAMPGQYGNTVIAGHRTSHDRPFRYIDQLVPGDDVIFTTADGTFTYKVVRTEIVLPDAVWIVDQTPGYTATLFACHPVGSTRERIVVFLELAV